MHRIANVLAAITEADVARRILACLAPPARAPPGAPARAMLEPTASASLGAAVPVPDDFDFDQSPPGECDAGA